MADYGGDALIEEALEPCRSGILFSKQENTKKPFSRSGIRFRRTRITPVPVYNEYVKKNDYLFFFCCNCLTIRA